MFRISTRSSPLALIAPNSFCGLSCLQPAPATRAKPRMVKLANFTQVIGVDFLWDCAITVTFTHSFLRQGLPHNARAKSVPSPDVRSCLYRQRFYFIAFLPIGTRPSGKRTHLIILFSGLSRAQSLSVHHFALGLCRLRKHHECK